MTLAGRSYFHTIDTVRSEVFIGILKSGEFTDVTCDGDILVEKTSCTSSVDQNTIILETDDRFRYLKHANSVSFSHQVHKPLSIYSNIHPSSHTNVVKMHKEVTRTGFSESVYPIKLKRQFMSQLGFSLKAEYFDLKMYSHKYVKKQAEVKSNSIFWVLKLAIPKLEKRVLSVPPMVTLNSSQTFSTSKQSFSANGKSFPKKPKIEYFEPSSNLEKLLDKFDPKRIKQESNNVKLKPNTTRIELSQQQAPSANIYSIRNADDSAQINELEKSVICTLQNLQHQNKPGLKPKDQLLTELKRENNNSENTDFQLLTASKEVENFTDIKSFSTGSSYSKGAHLLNTLQLSRKKTIGPGGEILIGETQLTLKDKNPGLFFLSTPETSNPGEFLRTYDDNDFGYLVPPTPENEKIPVEMKPTLHEIFRQIKFSIFHGN